MPALRQPVRRVRSWLILGAAVVLATAAAFDWTRPPARQASVYLYQRIVIGSYRSLVRPVTKRFVRCRYYPTCSQYSAEAVQLHGFPKGAWLSFLRICRCGPWVKPHTFDPVPRPAITR